MSHRTRSVAGAQRKLFEKIYEISMVLISLGREVTGICGLKNQKQVDQELLPVLQVRCKAIEIGADNLKNIFADAIDDTIVIRNGNNVEKQEAVNRMMIRLRKVVESLRRIDRKSTEQGEERMKECLNERPKLYNIENI